MDRRLLIWSFDMQREALVLGDRLVEVAYFADQRSELDLAEPFEPATMFYFGNAQEGCDDGQRLIETDNGLINDRMRFLQGFGLFTPAFEPNPHACERSAQVMCDVVADAGNLMNQSFDLVQHAVDAECEVVEGIVASAGRQAFAQIACHDTLDSLVDLG